MSFFSKLTSDGRLRHKHERLVQTGKRPPYLVEVYNSTRHLEEEANRLFALGYRIQSRQDVRGPAAFYYHVTFAYDPIHNTERTAPGSSPG